MTCLRVVAAACVLTAAGGCMMQEQSAPALAGPSGFALTMTLAATPEVLPGDGSSQAVVTLNARDQISDTPISGQRIALVAVPVTATLSTTEVTTGSDGRASFTVTAPVATDSDQAIFITAAPVSGVSDRVAPRQLVIPLIFDDTGIAPVAEFAVIPSQPKVGESVRFDASASRAGAERVIALYSWDFGDGTTAQSKTAAVDKTFDEARSFAVTLTVTDNLGGSATTGQIVTVAP